MFLFILESIGTSELMLIALVALILLGPRKMPGMARKIGKMMAEFRTTTNEFKSTWEREVDFSSELEALRIDDTAEAPVKRVDPASGNLASPIAQPSIKEVENVDRDQIGAEPTVERPSTDIADDVNDRKSWL